MADFESGTYDGMDSHLEAGKKAGRCHGQALGEAEGNETGLRVGSGLGKELGSIKGSCVAWRHLYSLDRDFCSEKVLNSIFRLEQNLDAFPRVVRYILTNNITK